MRIFITGGSGVLGRRLILRFVNAGHTVRALTRSERADEIVRGLGALPCRGDHFDAESLVHCAGDSEVVIHAATAIPSAMRFSSKDWEMNDALRRKGTQALTQCAGKIGAKLYLQQSIIWVARSADGSFFDENSTPHPAGLYASSLDAENISFDAERQFGFRVIVLRCGFFYSADSFHTKMIGEALSRRRARIVGKGDAVWAMIHSDDAASAFATAAESAKRGLWHVVDDRPVTVEEFFNEFASALNVDQPKHIPVWLGKLLLGKQTVAQFTTSSLTSNARFKNVFNWSPQFSTYQEGLRQIAEEWKGR